MEGARSAKRCALRDVLIEVVLEGGRLAGQARLPGRRRVAEVLDVDGDGGRDVLEVGVEVAG